MELLLQLFSGEGTAGEAPVAPEVSVAQGGLWWPPRCQWQWGALVAPEVSVTQGGFWWHRRGCGGTGGALVAQEGLWWSPRCWGHREGCGGTGGLGWPGFSEGLVMLCGDFLAPPAIPAQEELCFPSRSGREAAS